VSVIGITSGDPTKGSPSCPQENYERTGLGFSSDSGTFSLTHLLSQPLSYSGPGQSKKRLSPWLPTVARVVHTS
jgi:hypothetical protein